jgi:RHS repeat-associated protein
MPRDRKTLLCRYHYDPLDRLVDCAPTAQSNTQRFYLKDRLASEIQGAEQRSIMQHNDQLLAQRQRQSGTVETRLLATDQQRSVLNVLDMTHLHSLTYTPYGHRSPENGLLNLLGFNGECPDPVTGCFLLGNGYRAFNPVLMRFNSPDSWSPFGEGGLNGYVYCVGDPVNRGDPTGHVGNLFKGLLNLFGRIPSRARATAQMASPPPTVELPGYSEMETYFESRPRPPAYDIASAPSYNPPNPRHQDPPPLYHSGNQPPALSQHQQAGLQNKLNRASAHLQRVEENTRNLSSISPSIQETIDSLRSEINTFHSNLGRTPLYTKN